MYYAKVNWFNESEEADTISHIFILARDWNEAMSKINAEFTYINSIEITQIYDDYCNVIYVNDHMIDDLIRMNEP